MSQVGLIVLEQCRACREENPSARTPADFIVWGKLFPPEALGPRCYQHAAEQIGATNMDRIDQWAVFDLRPLVAEVRVARDVISAAQEHKSELLWACTCGCVERALAAYDKVTGEQP